jgi:translocation and assembly module TamB
MMKRLIKYLVAFVIVLILLVLVATYTLLHTQTGAKWVIGYISEQNPLIKVESVEGTLANDLRLSGVQYKDESIVINTNQLTYKINDIYWFDRSLDIQLLSIDLLDITTIKSTHEELNNSPFEGIELPIDISVKEIRIKQLIFNDSNTSESFNDLYLSLSAKQQDVVIPHFSVKHKDIILKTKGRIKLTSLLPFELSPKWAVNSADINLTGSGKVSGSVDNVSLVQTVVVKQNDLTGDYSIRADIDLTKDVLAFSSFLKSNNTKIIIPDDEINLNALELEIMGDLNQYNLQVTSELESQVWPNTIIQANGQGNLEAIDLKQLSITNSMSQIEGPTRINWKEGVDIDSLIKITQVNPHVFLKDWQGSIDGKINLNARILENNHYSISLKDTNLTGQLKQQDFKFVGSVMIDNNSIEIKNSHLSLGANKIDLDVIINEDLFSGNFIADISDLSLIDKDLKGKITSEFKAKGTLNNPEISGFATGTELKLNNISLKNIDITGQGQLNSDFTLSVIGNALKVDEQQFESIALNLSGQLSKHKLQLKVDGEDYLSEIKAIGNWDQQKQIWSGTLEEHFFKRSDIDSHWALENAIDMSIGQDIKVSKSCWSNKNSKGNLCMDFHSKNNYSNYQGKLDLDELELTSFKAFMPKNLLIDGVLNGRANIDITDDNINIDSDIKLIGGKLRYAEKSEEEYISKINSAQIIAQYKNQKSLLTTEIYLEDGTSVVVTTEIIKGRNNHIEVDGTIKGQFKNTRYLASLSEEIREIKGGFEIDGTILGPINQLDIKLFAAQKQGHLILSQTGSKLENLSIKLNKDHSIKGANQKFDFEIKGNTGIGFIKSEGLLALDEDLNWQITGQATGENFRLLTLPEIELDISPQLDFNLDKNQLIIVGDVNIPYGKVAIQSLPESAVSTSADVVIHTQADEKQENKEQQDKDFIVTFNVNALLEKPLSLNALGLTTNVIGNLRVTNLKNAAIDGFGALQLNDGSYKIYGQTLDISQGELIFNGPITNPTLDVKASRKSISQDVIAGVELGGTINRLQSSLYSEPSLPDLEILSYILTGRGLNQESDTSSEQLAQAAILLGLQKSSPVFSQIQSKFGIDVLTIKEGVTTKESIVEAGKNINDDIYIGYNQGLFNRLGFWVLRYQINKALRLETTQGEDQSVDLIYVRKKK